MSRCTWTAGLLDATFAGIEPTRNETAHIAACAECARALAQARALDRELHRIGLELSPEEMPALLAASDGIGSRKADVTTMRRAILGGIAATLLMAVALGGVLTIGGSFVGSEPTEDLPATAGAAAAVVAPLGTAPGRCGEVTEFEYVAVTTMRELGLGELRDDPDYNRPGRFWVTAERLDIPMPSWAPSRPPARMLCVEWADGDPIGMLQQALPDHWVAPPR